MKKLLTFMFSGILAVNAFAAHILSADIAWEPTSTPNTYKFYLMLTHDCSGISLGPTEQINSPWGTITLSRDTTITQASYSCDSTQTCSSGFGVERIIYTNDTVKLLGAPPTTGWKFTKYVSPPGGVNTKSTGINATTTIYPINFGVPDVSTKPVITEFPSYSMPASGKNAFSVAIDHDPQIDSVIYQLDSFSSGSQGLAYKSGYSPSAPLPDGSENSANGAQRFNSQTGSFYYDIDSANTGWYFYNVRYKFYKEGQLATEMSRTLPVRFEGASSGPMTQPSFTATVGTNTYNSGAHIYLDAFIGDSLNISLVGSDIGQSGSSGLELMAMIPHGKIFQPNVSAQDYNRGKLVSKNSNGKLSAAIQNKAEFQWLPDNGNLLNCDTYHFSVEVRDDGCPQRHSGMLDFTVNLRSKVEILTQGDTLRACGDSVEVKGFTKSGQYQWSPGTYVNDSTSANPVITGTSPGWLYLKAPNVAGVTDSIYVTPVAGNISLQKSGSKLILQDSVGLSHASWHLNSVAFTHPSDTLQPKINGQYWVEADTGDCHFVSNSARYDSAKGIALNDSGLVVQGPQTMDSTLAIDFSYNNATTGTETYMLSKIYLYGISDGSGKRAGGDVTVKLYDANGNQLWKKMRTIANPQGAIEVFSPKVNFKEGNTLSLSVQADSGLYFELYRSVNTPLTIKDQEEILKIHHLRKGAGSGLPLQAGSTMPAMGVRVDALVGFKDFATSRYSIYPNPVKYVMNFESPFSNKAEATIYTTDGKEVIKRTIKKGEHALSLRGLPKGFYILKIKTESEQSILHFIKE